MLRSIQVLAFVLRLPRLAEINQKAVVLSILPIGMQPFRLIPEPFANACFETASHQSLRQTSKVLEGIAVPAQPSINLLIEYEFHGSMPLQPSWLRRRAYLHRGVETTWGRDKAGHEEAMTINTAIL